MKFWSLSQDMVPDPWPRTLSAVEGRDNWTLVAPGPLEAAASRGDLRCPVADPGAPRDYAEAGHAGVPILSRAAAEVFASVAGVTLLPVAVAGDPAPHAIAHVAPEVACLDTAGSDLTFFGADDPVRPDLAGRIRSVVRLVIDAEAAQASGHEAFRLARGSNYLIVSDRLRARCRAAGLTGLRFACVTPEPGETVAMP